MKAPIKTAQIIAVLAECVSVNARDLVVKEIQVKRGTVVAADQLLMSLEMNKIVTEIRAPVAGRVKKIYVKPEDEVQPGDKLLDLQPL